MKNGGAVEVDAIQVLFPQQQQQSVSLSLSNVNSQFNGFDLYYLIRL